MSAPSPIFHTACTTHLQPSRARRPADARRLPAPRLPLVPYLFLFSKFRVTTLSPSLLTWALLFLGVDPGYWAYRRPAVRTLWASNVVHHQSEEYNLTTALRQSWFTAAISWVFYMPMAILGFPAEMFVVVYTLDIVYQFWIHTRTVGKLGPLEGS
ncbi:MAG: hypothetical protein R3F14_07770 [Polyangiaceae bacterium]